MRRERLHYTYTLSLTFIMSTISVKIEFGGGLELLFANQRSYKVSIPAQDEGKPVNITFLMYWLRDNLLKEREELFIENGTV